MRIRDDLVKDCACAVFDCWENGSHEVLGEEEKRFVVGLLLDALPGSKPNPVYTRNLLN